MDEDKHEDVKMVEMEHISWTKRLDVGVDTSDQKLETRGERADVTGTKELQSIRDEDKYQIEAEEEEDLSLVQKLPSEVLAKIFCCLPIASVLQLSSVCKQWRCIICSGSFPRLWSQHSVPQFPWIIMYHGQRTFAAYNPSSERWLTLPVPLPVEIMDPHILASSGGLLCFGSSHGSRHSLIVCNPITGDWRLLPEIPLHQDKFLIKMVADKVRACYKIYVTNSLDDDFLNWTLESMVYSSSEGYWHPLQLSELLALEGCQRDHAIWCQGTCFSLSEGMPPHELIGYDTMINQWITMELPFERSMPLCPPLSTRKGRLYLAGVEWEHLPFSSFNIWELDMPSWNFNNVADRSCTNLLEDCFVSSLPPWTLERLGDGDFLFFHSRLLPSPLIYDLVEKSWYCLPRYHGPCKGWVSALVYDPSFSATA